MVFHRNQAQFERARWRKVLLLPMWALQTAMLLSLMGIFSYRLAETIENFQEDDKKGKKPVVELVWEGTNIGLSVTSLILTILEVSRLFSETLTPFFLLASHCIKMTSSFAILGLDIVVYTARSEGNWSIIGLAIDAGLLLSMLILGVYSIVKFRYVHDDDDMHHPANVKPFGFGNGYRQIEIDNVTGGDAFLRANPYNDVATEYLPQGGVGVGGGSTRDRSLSGASSLSQSLSRGQPEGGRRASYNHERDTQFDAYVSRAPPALSHDDVNHAISTELWGNTAGYPAAIDRSGSVVSSGVVASRPAQPRLDPANRTVSWTVESGRVSVPESNREEGSVPGTVPVPVPTIREEHVPDEEEAPAAAAAVAAEGHVRPPASGWAKKQYLLVGHNDDNDDDDDDGPEPESSHYRTRP